MPKRNRHKEQKRSGQLVVQPVVTKQDQDVRLFAESVRAQEASERRAREEAVEAMRRANRLDELRAAKAQAVAELKSARARGGADRIATAEAAYRSALAEPSREFEYRRAPHLGPRPPRRRPRTATHRARTRRTTTPPTRSTFGCLVRLFLSTSAGALTPGAPAS